MSTSILALDRVTKRFAGHTAVDALSLDVPAGVIYGLLGPNGAGKSTTIRMIMNIYIPDGGTVRLFGETGRCCSQSPPSCLRSRWSRSHRRPRSGCHCVGSA